MINKSTHCLIINYTSTLLYDLKTCKYILNVISKKRMTKIGLGYWSQLPVMVIVIRNRNGILIQNLDKAVCISIRANALGGKGMNQTILLSAIGKL